MTEIGFNSSGPEAKRPLAPDQPDKGQSGLDAILESDGGGIKWYRPTPARVVLLLLATFFVWAGSAQLDEVATAAGEVIPQEQLKVVQHLEGGIIEEIDVDEGDLVKAGEPLVKLNLGRVGFNRDELQVRLDGLLLQRARLKAEVDGTEPEFPQKAAERHPDLVNSEKETFASRKKKP